MFLNEVYLEIKCASIPELLTRLTDYGVTVLEVEYIDHITVRCRVPRKDYRALKYILDKTGAVGKVLGRSGFLLKLARLRNRPVLVFGVLLMLALVMFLPNRILFITVTGNNRIATKFILEKASENGVYFGASRQGIRSEKIKNALLGEISELQWAGINTYGCLAVISVQERKPMPENYATSFGTGMVAAKDGIITEISVTQGTTLCKVGQAVKRGQLLVSGIADYGICVKETGADGEIYAQTGNVLRVFSLRNAAKKESKSGAEKRYSVILGKNMINFYKGSGISGTNCDRMYTQYHLVLPGGLQLPISFVVEEICYYEIEPVILPKAEMGWITISAEAYLLDHTVAGEILSKTVSVKVHDGICELYGVYQCREIISRYQHKGV